MLSLSQSLSLESSMICIYSFCSDICTTQQQPRSWLDNLTKKQPWLSPWLPPTVFILTQHFLIRIGFWFSAQQQSKWWFDYHAASYCFGPIHNCMRSAMIWRKSMQERFWNVHCSFAANPKFCETNCFQTPSKIRPVITSESLSLEMKIALNSSVYRYLGHQAIYLTPQKLDHLL